jgi:uncharacterized protein (UPF0261 family)
VVSWLRHLQGDKETIRVARAQDVLSTQVPLIRPSHAEMKTIGETVYQLPRQGPVTVFLPLRARLFGLKAAAPRPEGDRILFEALKSGLRKDIPVIENEMHVNEEPFADLIVTEFLKIMAKPPHRAQPHP